MVLNFQAETPVTSLELNTWLRKTLQTSMDQTVSDEIFQGSYWCEAWKTKPFVREKSKEIFVRFTGTEILIETMGIDIQNRTHHMGISGIRMQYHNSYV